MHHRLKLGVGADGIHFGIDIDEQQPVVVVLVRPLQPVERQSARRLPFVTMSGIATIYHIMPLAMGWADVVQYVNLAEQKTRLS